jgi:hypothetical protein
VKDVGLPRLVALAPMRGDGNRDCLFQITHVYSFFTNRYGRG